MTPDEARQVIDDARAGNTAALRVILARDLVALNPNDLGDVVYFAAAVQMWRDDRAARPATREEG